MICLKECSSPSHFWSQCNVVHSIEILCIWHTVLYFLVKCDNTATDSFLSRSNHRAFNVVPHFSCHRSAQHYVTLIPVTCNPDAQWLTRSSSRLMYASYHQCLWRIRTWRVSERADRVTPYLWVHTVSYIVFVWFLHSSMSSAVFKLLEGAVIRFCF